MATNISTGVNGTADGNLRESHGLMFVAYHIIGSVGIFGNALVIVVIFNFRAMRSKNVNVLVLNQSFIDMFASGFIIAQTHIDTGVYLEGVWDDIVCRFWLNAVPLWSLLMASTINILVITLERYVAVVHPLRYHNINDVTKRRVTCVAMASAWIVALVFNCALTSTTSAVRDHRCISMSFFHNEGWRKTAGLAAFLFEFLVPISVCVICYACIIQTLRQKVAPATVAATSSQGGPVNAHVKTMMIRNVHKTFGIVVLCAILCNAVNQCLFLAFNWGYALNFSGTLYNASVIASFSNCCVNPFVYAFKYTMFQQGMKKLFCRKSTEVSSAHTTNSDVRRNVSTRGATVHM